MPSPNKTTISNLLLPPLTAIATALFSLLLFLTTPFCKITRTRRTVPSDSKPPHRFNYSTLRRATDSFSPSHLVGRGGFGSVYRGTLPHTQKEIAVKLLDSGSLQGEREFQNEILFTAKIDSPFIVSVFGFCSDKKRRRMMLVYDLMENGNLQDALLRRKCVELMEWKIRFSVAVDIAKGLEYLHGLDPPVIHGDIKPSNVLLDRCFEARIGDFGLARSRSERNSPQYEVCVKVEFNGGGGLEKEEEKKKRKKEEELKSVNGGSMPEFETESVATTTGFEEINNNVTVDQSPDNSVSIAILETSPEKLEETGPVMSLERAMALDGKKDGNLVKSSRSRRDWSWKQENEVKGESGSVKDYVMEWIGTEISRERPSSDWITASTSSSSSLSGKMEKKKSKKRLEWWMTMDEEKNPKNVKYQKRKLVPPKEWWKEEYCEELAKKKKKKNKKTKMNQFNETMSCDEKEDEYWPVSEELYKERKKKAKSRSRGSWSSIDWWLDGLSNELRKARRHSYDSSDIPKSGNISSTPSMRGTMCYIAPEYGIGGDLSEKCDVYSFGVLLLVVVAGRRPFQLTNSPSLEFRRANLISWARHLARSGKLVELVDQSIASLDLEQALLSITIALLCLQKSPARRPSMKDVVGMLTGKLGPPQLPSELSPSRFTAKSHRKVR